MRYHFEKPDVYFSMYGSTYSCDHPVYDKCALYQIEDKGLAVIQQRFKPDEKATRCGEIDPWLTDTLYLHHNYR